MRERAAVDMDRHNFHVISLLWLAGPEHLLSPTRIEVNPVGTHSAPTGLNRFPG